MNTDVVGPIAIDGDAASGKTTAARTLARRYGFRLLDTGRMYRAFTLAALRAGVPATDTAACEALANRIDLMVLPSPEETRVMLDGVDVSAELDSRPVEDYVSGYSKVAGVRAVMVAMQRTLAADGRVVVVGRDIGTVVLPEAPAKLFLVASAEVQARRRASQHGLEFAVAQDNVNHRNATDRGRATSPTTRAQDALEVDTSEATEGEVAQTVLDYVRERLGR